MLFGVAERYGCRAQQRQGENKRGSVRPNSRKDSGMYVCVSVCACMGAPAHVFCVFFFFLARVIGREPTMEKKG